MFQIVLKPLKQLGRSEKLNTYICFENPANNFKSQHNEHMTKAIDISLLTPSINFN